MATMIIAVIACAPLAGCGPDRTTVAAGTAVGTDPLDSPPKVVVAPEQPLAKGALDLFRLDAPLADLEKSCKGLGHRWVPRHRDYAVDCEMYEPMSIPNGRTVDVPVPGTPLFMFINILSDRPHRFVFLLGKDAQQEEVLQDLKRRYGEPKQVAQGEALFAPVVVGSTEWKIIMGPGKDKRGGGDMEVASILAERIR